MDRSGTAFVPRNSSTVHHHVRKEAAGGPRRVRKSKPLASQTVRFSS